MELGLPHNLTKWKVKQEHKHNATEKGKLNVEEIQKLR